MAGSGDVSTVCGSQTRESIHTHDAQSRVMIVSPRGDSTKNCEMPAIRTSRVPFYQQTNTTTALKSVSRAGVDKKQQSQWDMRAIEGERFAAVLLELQTTAGEVLSAQNLLGEPGNLAKSTKAQLSQSPSFYRYSALQCTEDSVMIAIAFLHTKNVRALR
jgi:hypothetical protein